MNFDFAEEVNPFIEKHDFAGALRIAELNLSKVEKNDFHNIIGKSINNQLDAVVEWISEFYNSASKMTKVAALYFEFTEFDINQDVWEIDGFAYDRDEGLNDIDWFSDMTEVAPVPFIVKGYEELQEAFYEFGNLDEPSDDLILSRDWCEQIVIIRFAELMVSAHQTAKNQNLAWASIPLYFTEHGYDFIINSIN